MTAPDPAARSDAGDGPMVPEELRVERRRAMSELICGRTPDAGDGPVLGEDALRDQERLVTDKMLAKADDGWVTCESSDPLEKLRAALVAVAPDIATGGDGQLTPYAELAAVLDALPLLFREARRRHGHSLRQASDATGVPFSTIHRLEGGMALPRMQHGAALLRYIS